MKRIVTAAALHASLLAASTGFGFASEADSIQWLQYDAVMVQNESAAALDTYALFVRYHLDANRTAIEVIHHEPSWNVTEFVWMPIGLAIDSHQDQLAVHNTFQDSVIVVDKPYEDDAELVVHGYPPEHLARSEGEMVARIQQYMRALQPAPEDDVPVEIHRTPDDRVDQVMFLAPGGDAVQSASRYSYSGNGKLERIETTSAPVTIPVPIAGQVPPRWAQAGGAVPMALYHEGGRSTRIEFEEVDAGKSTLLMPVHVEVRRSSDGAFVRSARHHDFLVRTLPVGTAPPWETWEHARLSSRESRRIWMMANEGYWLGERAPSPEHAAFYETFVVPLDSLSDSHPGIGFRLRAFTHAYVAAMILDDSAYLREGISWYLSQVSTLESPEILLKSGQECIRLLIRWGYDDIVEEAFAEWRKAIFAMDAAITESALGEYARRGIPYYSFRLFDPDDDLELSPSDRFRFQYWRSLAVRQLGLDINRDKSSVLGRSSPWWAEVDALQWSDIAAAESMKAIELHGKIEAPTTAETRMLRAVEELYIQSQNGDGFLQAEAGFRP